MNFNTIVIHGGQEFEASTGAIMPPIYQTSTFAQTSPGEHKGYEYSRAANPTRTALEKNLAAIENGNYGFAFASGLSATDALLKLFNPNDEIIVFEDLYGGSFRMFIQIFQKFGIKFKFIKNTNDLNSNISKKTKLIWLESPSNPLLKIVDIKEVTKISKNNGILVAVDNTFATPFIQQPLNLGADIVMHSATKYLSGHSDVIAGALIVKDEKLAERIHFQQYAGGGILGPQDSFLVLRGIKTLALRMKVHCENGEIIAEYLKNHTKINQVFYPKFDENINMVNIQMNKKYGGMLSFNFKSKNRKEAYDFFSKIKLFTLAESLGGVESLANHPTTMTHASIPEEIRLKSGITDDLIRLSIGIEDINDLLNDLENALK